MSGRNGLAVVPGAQRILHVVPRTTTYAIERADGETVMLAGYHKGPTCPVPVNIEVDAAFEVWEAAQPTPDERKAMKPRAFIAQANRAELIWRRDMLCAVIPGLEHDEANVLAAEGGQWEAILVELGWQDAAPAQSKGDADPEATAPAEKNAAPTGAASSPEQPQPIQASIS